MSPADQPALPCPRCMLYASARGPVVRREIDKLTASQDETERRWERFLADYHELHVKASRFVALLAALDEEAS